MQRQRRRSGGIEFKAVTQRRGDHKGGGIPIALDVIGCNDDDIDGVTHTDEPFVDGFRQFTPVEVARLHNQQVEVALGPVVSAGGGAEDADPFGDAIRRMRSTISARRLASVCGDSIVRGIASQ